MHPCTDSIQDKLAQGDLKTTLEEFGECLKTNDPDSLALDEIAMQISRLRIIQEKARKQTLTLEQVDVAVNQIMDDLLQLTRELNQPTPNSPLATQAVYLSPASRPPLSAAQVLGREKELEYLREQLREQQASVAVTGMGGIGKTTLAGYYVQKSEDHFRHIAWINFLGDLKNDLIAQVTNYQALQWQPEENAGADKTFEQLVFALHRLQGPNLLIIDNVNTDQDAANLNQYWQALPPHWNVIVTSRVQVPGIANYPIGVLHQQAIEALFQRFYRFRPGDTEEQMRELLEQIGHHTLVTELLAKTLTELEHLNLAGLLQRIRDKGLGALNTAAPVSVAHSHQAGVKVSDYLLTLFDLSTLTEEEKMQLSLFSVMPPLAYSFEDWTNVLQTPEGEERDELMYLFSTLRKKGWLEKTETGFPSNYFMSPVIQEVVRAKIPPSSQAAEPLFVYFHLKIQEVFNQNPVEALIYVPYATSLLRHIPEENEITMNLAQDMGLLLRTSAEFEEALSYIRRAIAYFEKHPEGNEPILITAYNNLALIQSETGRNREALASLHQALDLQEKIGQEVLHPGLANNNLGMIYKELGELEKALEYQQKALEAYQKHPDTTPADLALGHSNLALLYQYLGKYDLAIEHQRQSIDLLENNAPNHPNLALAYNNMGHLYFLLGDYDQSLDFLSRAFELEKKIFDQAHPLLGQTLNNIAFAYKELGEFEKSLEFQQACIEVFEEIFPSYHSMVALGYHNLGLIYQSAGDSEKALKNIQYAVELREQNPDANPIDLAAGYHELGTLYAQLQQPDKADELLRKSLDFRKQLYRPPHRELVMSYNALALLAQSREQVQEAIRHELEAIGMAKQIFTPDHPQLGQLYQNLAIFYVNQEEYAEAQPWQEEAIRIFEKAGLTQNPQLYMGFYNGAIIYIYLGLADKAREYAQKAYDYYPEGSPYKENAKILLGNLG